MGSPANGVASNGVASNGVASNGVASNGVAGDGVAGKRAGYYDAYTMPSEHEDIFSAIMGDDLEAVVTFLYNDPATAAKHDGQSPVLLAAYRHRMDILKLLLSRQPELDIFEAS